MTRIVIDTDPGQDDAVAILLALACPELDVTALLSVAGNVELALATANALRVLDLAARPDIPVHPGAPRPLLVPLETASWVSGPDGLAGHDLPPPSRSPDGEHAALALIRLARTAPLTVCALGPLTNVALALALQPDLPLEEIVWMGGALGLGNMTAAAEFNAYVDPHAVAIVLDAGIPLRIFGLNVTHDAVPAAAELDRLRGGGACARAVAAWMSRKRARGIATQLYAWHDPCVVAALRWPDLFTYRACHVHMATEPGPTRGRTTIDWHGRSGLPPNARVAETIDARAFFDRVTTRLLTLP